MTTNRTTLTPYAQSRMQQRGVPKTAVACIALFHNRAVRMPGGNLAWSVSRQKLQELRNVGLPASTIGRMANTTLIVDPLNGDILTVIKGRLDTKPHRHRPRHRRAA